MWIGHTDIRVNPIGPPSFDQLRRRSDLRAGIRIRGTRGHCIPSQRRGIEPYSTARSVACPTALCATLMAEPGGCARS